MTHVTNTRATHYIALAVMRGHDLIGVTATAADLDPEPGDLDQVQALAERLTSQDHEADTLSPDLSYSILSWQRFA